MLLPVVGRSMLPESSRRHSAECSPATRGGRIVARGVSRGVGRRYRLQARQGRQMHLRCAVDVRCITRICRPYGPWDIGRAGLPPLKGRATRFRPPGSRGFWDGFGVGVVSTACFRMRRDRLEPGAACSCKQRQEHGTRLSRSGRGRMEGRADMRWLACSCKQQQEHGTRQEHGIRRSFRF
jgi:hypothetical protein